MQKEAQAGNFDVNAIGWSGRVDPDGNIHQFVTCKGGLNDGRYCNPEVDRILNEARASTTTRSARRSTMPRRRSCRTSCRSSTPTTSRGRSRLAKKVEGFKPYPDGMIRLKGVKFAS